MSCSTHRITLSAVLSTRSAVHAGHRKLSPRIGIFCFGRWADAQHHPISLQPSPSSPSFPFLPSPSSFFSSCTSSSASSSSAASSSFSSISSSRFHCQPGRSILRPLWLVRLVSSIQHHHHRFLVSVDFVTRLNSSASSRPAIHRLHLSLVPARITFTLSLTRRFFVNFSLDPSETRAQSISLSISFHFHFHILLYLFYRSFINQFSSIESSVCNFFLHIPSFLLFFSAFSYHSLSFPLSFPFSQSIKFDCATCRMRWRSL